MVRVIYWGQKLMSKHSAVVQPGHSYCSCFVINRPFGHNYKNMWIRKLMFCAADVCRYCALCRPFVATFLVFTQRWMNWLVCQRELMLRQVSWDSWIWMQCSWLSMMRLSCFRDKHRACYRWIWLWNFVHGSPEIYSTPVGEHHMLVSVCLSYLWSWLPCSALAVLGYVTYFWFCVCRHLCLYNWPGWLHITHLSKKHHIHLLMSFCFVHCWVENRHAHRLSLPLMNPAHKAGLSISAAGDHCDSRLVRAMAVHLMVTHLWLFWQGKHKPSDGHLTKIF